VPAPGPPLPAPGPPAGAVVGGFDTPDYRTHAFLYEGGTFRDLNSAMAGAAGWELGGATSINEEGSIVGAGYLNGVYGGFLLKASSRVFLVVVFANS